MSNIDQLLHNIRLHIPKQPLTMTEELVLIYGPNPYIVLISCILSLQTRDSVTLSVSKILFQYIQKPSDIARYSLSDIEQIISSINYYKTKARRLFSISQELLERFDGQVPQTVEELLSIKGIGLKTAHLVLGTAFQIPALCVDTHVHRLSNHWGIVNTKKPEETERALRDVVPRELWIEWSTLVVRWGQTMCKRNKVFPCDPCEKLFTI